MFTLAMVHVFILKLLLICVHVLKACVFIQHINNKIHGPVVIYIHISTKVSTH